MINCKIKNNIYKLRMMASYSKDFLLAPTRKPLTGKRNHDTIKLDHQPVYQVLPMLAVTRQVEQFIIHVFLQMLIINYYWPLAAYMQHGSV